MESIAERRAADQADGMTRRHPRWGVVAPLACLAAVLSGCGGDTSRADAAARCGPPDLPAHALRLSTADGVGLAAIEAGGGPRGVVLVPESGGRGGCGWWPYAAELVQHGFRVLLFDARCQGASACPAGAGDGTADTAAAVERLRRDGADRLAVLGASAGAGAAIAYAAHPAPGVRAVAALSADDFAQAGPAAPAVRLPVLLAVAADDPYASVDATRQLFAALGTPAADRTLAVLPAGAGHGWELTTGTAPADFRAELLDFLTRRLA
jgi:alpha-beta hydrolase superfamily lysophospholipase